MESSQRKTTEKNLNAANDDSIRAALPFLMFSTLFAGIAAGIVLTFIPGFLFADDNTPSEVRTISSLDDISDLSTTQLEQVYRYLQESYIGELPTEEDVEYGLIKGLISSLDDEYTSYLTPEEAQAYFDSRIEDFEGIGVTLAYDGDYTYVETVLEGLPAYQKGVLPGDIILEVDGEDVAGVVPQLVAAKVRGERGTDVTLTIFRQEDEGLGDTQDITITRDTIIVDNIMWNEVEEGIVEIDIAQFNAESADAFIANWDEVVDEIISEVPEVNGIIVDLRNNPGGYVIGVKHVMEEFFTNDTVLFGERSRSSQTNVYRDNRKGEFEEVPLTVIVNEGSASASEIFSAAVQDQDRGTVIGMPTVGKGVEQILIDDFTDGSLLILVFQQWLTPDGRAITADEPITPDIEVDYTTDNFENGEDPQFDIALEQLKMKF